MKIIVDADACPVSIKEILYKAAARTRLHLTLVANRRFRIPQSPYIHFLLVPSGADVADNKIVNVVKNGDLVITSDIPLAARIVEKGAKGLEPRGTMFTEENIKERLSTRDFFDNLRSAGVDTGGPAALSKRDIQNFANCLDRILSQENSKSV